jgi:chemotaxis protein histidine kinase CheA/ActR/RegA family two-component response regulator
MRAAHSLKGGAGIAELPLISRLAHKLEDGFQALIDRQLELDETLIGVALLTAEQLKSLLTIATTLGEFDTQDADATESLIAAWSDILATVVTPSVTDLDLPTDTTGNVITPEILKIVLYEDLESCLQRVEQVLTANPTPVVLRTALGELGEECTLLGQALGQNWLVDIMTGMQDILQDDNAPLVDLTSAILTEVRLLRSEILPPDPVDSAVCEGSFAEPEFIESFATQFAFLETDRADIEVLIPEESAIALPVASSSDIGLDPTVIHALEALSINPSVLPLSDAIAEAAPLPLQVVTPQPKEAKAASVETAPKPPAFLNLRIPVSRLDRMSNLIGELLISYERLTLQQTQLQQANVTLKKQTQQLTPINDEVQVFYDQLATAGIGTAASGTGGEGRNSEFDLLAFDQYTSLHTTLQSFQELMVQVQESRTDLDIISRDFQDSLAGMRQQLGGLYQDLTASRLVPFKNLAERFVAPLQGFCQRFNKLVELDIVGQETLVDQVLLEQLQTPLTHLLRNAFDHGIEALEDRLMTGKNPTARITLAAQVQGNDVIITLGDDGRGVDLQKVYQRARQLNLTRLDRDDLTDAQVLEFLFASGFSTAKAVTELSGRGVGLDAVRSQIAQLRGSIDVHSVPEDGTTFTIRLPLSLNILPLLLCRCQQQTLAIPSPNVREVIALAEYLADDVDAESIHWQNQEIPLFSLINWLPYGHAFEAVGRMRNKIGVVLDVNGQPVVVAVDTLLGERELVLKPFDTTVPVPAYIAGCTVLGSGEVVPVLSPERLTLLLDRMMTRSITPERAAPVAPRSRRILIADDSVAVRRFLEGLLTSAGYQVLACRDGKEALEALEQDSAAFSMVITDIEMPRLDGLGLLRSIRGDQRFCQMPVAMLTSRDNAQHRQKAKGFGADAYFTKPFQPNDLLAGVQALHDAALPAS